jgi:hypothetical protein
MTFIGIDVGGAKNATSGGNYHLTPGQEAQLGDGVAAEEKLRTIGAQRLDIRRARLRCCCS